MAWRVLRVGSTLSEATEIGSDEDLGRAMDVARSLEGLAFLPFTLANVFLASVGTFAVVVSVSPPHRPIYMAVSDDIYVDAIVDAVKSNGGNHV
jgi:hypothetical protein